MREIKFRGLAKSDNNWAYGYLIGSSFIGEIVHNSNGRPEIIEVCEVNIDTIGQYIGINDRNGKEIYTWDKLEFTDYVPELRRSVKGFDLVIFDKGKFLLQNRKVSPGGLTDVEIIGHKFSTKI